MKYTRQHRQVSIRSEEYVEFAKRREARRQKEKKQRNIIISMFATVLITSLGICNMAGAAQTSEVGYLEPIALETTIQESEEEETQNKKTEETISLETETAQEESTEETQIVEESEEETKEEENVENNAVLSAYNAGESYYYHVTYEDKIYMAKLVYQEARGESFEGKVAVAAVVLNRFNSNDRRFDRSSIYSVITQSGQFAGINSVTEGMLSQIPECMEAVEAALKGWDPTRKTFEEGAKFFYAPKGICFEESLKREGVLKLTIGNHDFHNDFAK